MTPDDLPMTLHALFVRTNVCLCCGKTFLEQKMSCRPQHWKGTKGRQWKSSNQWSLGCEISNVRPKPLCLICVEAIRVTYHSNFNATYPIGFRCSSNQSAEPESVHYQQTAWNGPVLLGTREEYRSLRPCHRMDYWHRLWNSARLHAGCLIRWGITSFCLSDSTTIKELKPFATDIFDICAGLLLNVNNVIFDLLLDIFIYQVISVEC